MSPATTPGQTVGPFFAFGLEYGGDSVLLPPGMPEAIRLHGRVLDGAGEPVPDALLELWQADADGAVVQASGSLDRDGHTFTGWGRCGTDRTGTYAFTTVAPGPMGPDAARFFSLAVFARGLLDRLFTRAYLPGQPDDALLASLDADRRSTLIATQDEHGYAFDVRLQGEGETVFLDLARHSEA
jgi:protocatechuate 3,4-dioxygenase, alpha subunit